MDDREEMPPGAEGYRGKRRPESGANRAGLPARDMGHLRSGGGGPDLGSGLVGAAREQIQVVGEHQRPARGEPGTLDPTDDAALLPRRVARLGDARQPVE